MKRTWVRFATPSGLLACSLIMLAGCGETKLDSLWRDREIVIDGADADWQDLMTYIEKADAAVGFLNDERYLYLNLTSTDRTVQTQVITRGFIVWFDPKGGKDKTFGIRFPLGVQGMDIDRIGRGRRPQGAGGGAFGRGHMTAFEALEDRFEDTLSGAKVEILRPGEDVRRRLDASEAAGIGLKMAYSKGRLVYEIKVSLAHAPYDTYAIGAGANARIGIGFETPEIDRDAIRERMAGRRPGGMRPGGGRFPGGVRKFPGGGGRMGGGRFGAERPEPFQLWLRVHLASGETL